MAAVHLAAAAGGSDQGKLTGGRGVPCQAGQIDPQVGADRSANCAGAVLCSCRQGECVCVCVCGGGGGGGITSKFTIFAFFSEG